MIRQSVSSSNIKSVGYDPASETLEIEFKGGAVYQYSGVPGIMHDELINADSIGSFFARNIRNEYNYKKVK